MSSINKRLNIFFSIVIIFLLALVIVPPKNTLAEPTPNKLEQNLKELEPYLFYYGMKRCMTVQNKPYQGSLFRLSPDDVDNGDLFHHYHTDDEAHLPSYFALSALGYQLTSLEKVNINIARCDKSFVNAFVKYHQPTIATNRDLVCKSGGRAFHNTVGSGEVQLEECTNPNLTYFKVLDSKGRKLSNLDFSQLEKEIHDTKKPNPTNAFPDYIYVAYLVSTVKSACLKKEVSPESITNYQNKEYAELEDEGVYKFHKHYYYGSKAGKIYVTVYDETNPDKNITNKTCADFLESFENNSTYASIIGDWFSTNDGDSSEDPFESFMNDVDSADEEENGEIKPSCNIEGVGWIICPVVKFLAKVTDGAMNFLEKNFLKIEASLLEEGKAAQKAWEKIRNIANVFFIIIFLIVIFSQLTSFGISNYGIKTMLPRLIIGAILVNLSFIICQLAVDLSNVVGNGVAGLFAGIAETIQDDELLSVPNLDFKDKIGSGGNTWGNLAGGTLAVVGGGILLYASLGALIPILLGAVIAALGILLMLAARKALIVMLVVISPLAIIAYLFPNKSVNALFGKWQKIFVSLLMLYPIISFVYSGSKLTSQVLTDAYKETKVGHEEKQDPYNLGQIIAAGVGVLPLFLIPGMLKKSLDSLGKVGATISGLSGKLQGSAKNKWTNSDLAKNMEKNKAQNRATIHGGTYQGKNPFNKVRSGANRWVNKIPSSYGYRRSATGETMAEKQNKEDVEMAAIQLKNKNLSPDDTLKIAMGEGDGKNNIALRQAAIKSVVETGNIDGIEALWDQSLELGDNEKDPKAKMIRSAFANSLMSSSSRSAGLGAGAIAKLESGTLDRNEDTFHGTLRQAVSAGAFSPDKLVSEDKDMLKKVRQAIQFEDRGGAPLTEEQTTRQESMKRQMVVAAHQAQTNPNTSVKISKNKEAIDNFARRIYPPPAP